MFRKVRRILAGIIASALILTSAGCGVGKSTAYALTIDGYQVKAGVYIYYSYSALSEAKSLAQEVDESVDTDDEAALKKMQIEGKDFMTWVQDKTTETCKNHVAVIKHFEELGLSLTDDENSEITSYVDSAWDSESDMFEGNGISRDSLLEIITMSYMTEAVFDAYYGEDGSEGVTDDQLKDFYVENHIRAKYIAMDMHDADGNELDDAGKKELEDMADDFLSRAKEAGKESQQAMLDEFDTMQDEYDAYVSAQAEEAAADEEDEDTDTDTETETEAETEAETEEETTEAAADEESEDAEVSDEDTSAEEETEAPTEAPDDESDEEAETTTAPESEEEEETTTTVSPYANETIISVVTTADTSDSDSDDTDDEDVTYTPSKVCYDWLVNDAVYDVPEIVEDEDEQTLYVIVRLDINDRVNADDLWTDSTVSSTRNSMFYDDFEDMLTEWADSYDITKNEKAYKRYDPFDIVED